MSQVEERLDFESMWETITNSLDTAGDCTKVTATVVHQPEAPALEALTEVEDDSEFAASSHDDEGERARLIGLVEKAREGDSEAFGQLYDHYQPSVYRFLYYRVGSAHLAEDLTADTFFRALRSVSTFRWQGKDFGAWLMTIARNLSTDHFKSSRTRLEAPSDDLGTFDAALPSPGKRRLDHTQQRDPAERPSGVAHRTAGVHCDALLAGPVDCRDRRRPGPQLRSNQATATARRTQLGQASARRPASLIEPAFPEWSSISEPLRSLHNPPLKSLVESA